MRTFYCALFCALISFTSFSQEKKEVKKDTIKINKLDEVLVTGNNETDPVLTIEKNDYDKNLSQLKNVADLFKDINGFSLIKRGNYAIDPSFRASQYEQLNVQFDGGTKAMHACPNRMDPITTHVIPEEIEKIEVIKGPYTVRYGATFGGIINMVTKKPNYEGNGFHGKASTNYQTNGQSIATMLQLQQVTDTYDIVANAGYRDFSNYKDGDGVEVPSAFRSTDYGLKFGYNISEKQRIKLGWRQSFGRDVLHAGLPMDTDEDNSSIASIDYKLSNLDGVLNAVTAKIYYSYVDHIMSNTRRPSFMMTDAISKINATTSGGKIEFKLIPSKKLKLFTGIDMLNIARDGKRNRLVKLDMMGNPLPNPVLHIDKIWQDSYVNDVGLFAESKYNISKTSILTTGIRFDYVTSEIKDPEADFLALYSNLDKKTEGNVSATISLKSKISKNHILEIAYGRGVRTANMSERYINHFSIGQDPYEYVGNPNLKAEVNNQFEIGIKGKKQYSNSTINAIKYGLSGYYAAYKNYIVAVVDPTLSKKFMPNTQPQEVKRFINLDNAYKTGFEMYFSLKFMNHFRFKSDFSYVFTKNKDLDESLPLTPPFTTKFHLGYEKEKFWTSLNFDVVATQKDIANSFREIETKGYETMDFKVGFKPTDKFTFGASILNVFDTTYHDHLNFTFKNQANFNNIPINEPGRNFTAFIQYKF